MRIRGKAARDLCEEVLAQWGDAVPASVTVTIDGTGSVCVISVIPNHSPERIAELGEQGRRDGSVSIPVSISTHRFGTLLPIGSRSDQQRRVLTEVAVALQHGISKAAESTWPSEASRARTQQHSGTTRVWFEDPDGTERVSASIDLSLFR